MNRKKEKKLKAQSLEQGKRISVHLDESSSGGDKETPIFCLNLLQSGYCVRDCTQEQQAAFSQKLREMSFLNWEQLRQAGRTGMGYEKLARHSIKPPIPKAATEEVNLIGIRFHDRSRMVGFRVRRLFRVIWLDHDYSVYDHE